MKVSRPDIALAVGSAAVAVTLAGMSTVGASPALSLDGSAEVTTDGLRLSAGTRLGVGTGNRVDVTGAFPRAAVDLVRGDPDGARVVAHLGGGSGIFLNGTQRLGADPPSDWLAGRTNTVTFDCRGTAVLLVDGMPRSNAPLGRPCTPEPLWVVAPNALTLSSIKVDGHPVSLSGRRFDPVRGVAAGVAVLGLLSGGRAVRRRMAGRVQARVPAVQGGGG